MRIVLLQGAVLLAAFTSLSSPCSGQVVPGTGTKLTQVGDDFEAEDWKYTLHLPKASSNIDKQVRAPSGFASNMRFFESTYRGTPDYVKRVKTPEGGLPGSTGALAMQTLNTGVPGRNSREMQQDDLIANVSSTIGTLSVNRSPSFVVRVYLQPFDKWEKRTGSSFGFRADCQTIIEKPMSFGRFFRQTSVNREIEEYWPGFFIQFNSKADRQLPEESATLLIRAGSRGEEITGPTIKKPGWWTLGMSFTPDGQVHYYAREGVENLTAANRIASSFPYGYKCHQVNTFFFNVVNMDDGQTWSTKWIVDDPAVYVLQ